MVTLRKNLHGTNLKISKVQLTMLVASYFTTGIIIIFFLLYCREQSACENTHATRFTIYSAGMEL